MLMYEFRNKYIGRKYDTCAKCKLMLVVYPKDLDFLILSVKN